MLELTGGHTEESREIIERAHLMRAEAIQHSFRALRDAVRNLFTGAPRHA